MDNTPNNTNDNSSPKASSFDATHLVALFGFSCYLVWEFFSLFQMNPLLTPFFTTTELNILRPITFCCISFGFVAGYFLSPRMTKLPMKAFFGLGLISSLGPLPIALLGYFAGSVPFWLGVIAWILFGLSMTLLMLLWALYFIKSSLPRMSTMVVLSYVVSFLVFLLLSLIQASLLVYVFVGFILIASTFSTFAFLWRGSLPFTNNREYRDVSRTLSPRGLLYSGSYGVIYGFVLTFLISLGQISALVGAIGGILGCVLTLILFARSKTPFSNTYFRRATFAPVIVAVLFLPIGGSWSYIGCSILIIVATVSTAIVGWITTSQEMSQRKMNPVAFFSLFKIPGWIGIFIGSLIGSLMLEFAPNMFSIVTILLAALISLSFFAFEMQLHGSEKTEPETPMESATTTRFHNRCTHIIKECGLSPREAEVFHLLARGRNAEYISLNLHIAKPTTKTHIQHIYQKLGINSHQELIDIIDYQRSA